MKRLTLLLPPLVLCLVGSRTTVVAQDGGIIEGQVANGTAGAPPERVADLQVMLYRADVEPGELLASTTSDSEGRFRFEDVDTDPAYVYRTQLEYRGVVYNSEASFAPGDTILHLIITIHETTDSDRLILADSHHIIVDFAADALLLQEMSILDNTGDTTHVGEESAAVHFSLPEGAANLTLGDPETESGLVRHDDGLALVRPIKPGQSEVRYSYSVPYDGGQTALSWMALYPSGHIDVFVANVGTQVASQDLEYQGLTGGEGASYLHFDAEDLPAGSEIELLISGVAREAAVPVSASPSWSRGLQEVGPVIAMTMGALGALLAFAQLRWGRRSEPLARQPAEPTPQRDELLQLIADLDDAFTEDRLDQQAYEQLRARMKQRLRDIWTEL
jgi:hypothetical protein